MATKSTEWLLFDVGSHTTRAGIGGNDEPSFTLPSVVENSFQTALLGPIRRPLYVGQQLLDELDELPSYRPVSGPITNFDSWQTLMEFCFTQGLRKPIEDHRLFLTEIFLCPKRQREKCLEIAVETWNVLSYSTASTHVLSLYNEGLTTGLICELGEFISKVVPVIEGYGLPHAVTSICDFGKEATETVSNLIASCGVILPQKGQILELERAKAQCSFVRPLDANTPMATRPPSQYVTKEHDVIDLGEKWDYTTKMLFSPENRESLQENFRISASRCFADQRELLGNIVISGGGSLIPGLVERLQEELQKITSFKVKVHRPPTPTLSPWLGMATLVDLPSFEAMVIHKEDYEENGPSLVHRRCFV